MMVALGYFDEPGKALLLGLGGGSLASFVSKYTHWQLQAVEFDEAIVQVAKTYFGLSDSIETHVQDALKFVAECRETFQIIWLDIDSKDVGQALTCPPEEFLEEAFLEKVVQRLSEDGVFAVNLACRDENKCTEVYAKLRKKFKYMTMVEVFQDINKVVLASNFEQTSCKFDQVKSLLKDSHKDNDVANLSNMIKGIDIDLKQL